VRLPLLLSLTLLAGLSEAPAAETPSEHWSLRPRSRPAVPALAEPPARQWVRNPIDAFILQRLAQTGLAPAAEADRATLLRRVSLDLTGLPPTPEEVAAFIQDPAPDAYERLVERLLVSPAYGERWGRHWLDVVRYAETEGFEYDRLRPGAWRYRDYVIQAFQEDKPFDRFLLEQLAGDELEPDNQELLVAAGFHRLGPVRRNAGNQKLVMSRNEVLTEMTDAIGGTFLGLTMGCARCHDHKFDDISQKDYYRLEAFLAATQEHDVVLASTEEQAEWKARTEKLKAEIQQLKKQSGSADAASRRARQDRLAELQRNLPDPLPTISTVRNVGAERTPIHVLRRGDPDRQGTRVGPRALGVLLRNDTPELAVDMPNPRTRLAQWLASRDHPLTARVWVNRVWQYHFGRGLVATANDFGRNGAPPSHPELLDYLANELVRGGWRTRPLHRLIVRSSTYRQSAVARDLTASQRLDPDNRLLGHFPRRRLSAEELRDAMLAVAGPLQRKAGGPSVTVPIAPDLARLLYDPAQWRVTADVKEHDRRSVYLLARRNLQLPFLQVFDQPDGQVSCPRREASTHALQALELLNGKLTQRLADALAERLVHDCPGDRPRQVDRAFALALGRPPTARERELAMAFLGSQPLREFALALFNLNAFIYVD
jgi:hypothetical protein